MKSKTFEDKTHQVLLSQLEEFGEYQLVNTYKECQNMHSGLTEREELNLLLDRLTDYCLLELDGWEHRSVLWDLCCTYFYDEEHEEHSPHEKLKGYCDDNLENWEFYSNNFEIGFDRCEPLLSSAFSLINHNLTSPRLAVIICKRLFIYITMMHHYEVGLNYSLLKRELKKKYNSLEQPINKVS